MTITKTLLEAFKNISFSLKQAYERCPDVKKDSVRARIYEALGISFERIGKGLYIAKNEKCMLIHGDGRDLSIFNDNSFDCIITDHPWSDTKSNKGGSRNFAAYNCFEYTQHDFDEKARVLKNGNFLCEVIPAENESNFDYLYKIKKMAEKAGFQYYAKVPWIKGNFVSNTGRKAKNSEDLMIFSKGKARALRLDAKKTKALGSNQFMSGTNGMLPTNFNVQAIATAKKINQSEKPSELFEQLLEYITLNNELVLDQFAGSGSVGAACIKTHRRCILIEKEKQSVDNIIARLNLNECKTLTAIPAAV